MLIETVAIVTLNSLAIITCLNEHSLHQRSTYLAINQTVVGDNVIIQLVSGKQL